MVFISVAVWAVSIHWTGLLDSPKMVLKDAFSSLFQCRREASHVHSAYFFARSCE